MPRHPGREGGTRLGGGVQSGDSARRPPGRTRQRLSRLGARRPAGARSPPVGPGPPSGTRRWPTPVGSRPLQRFHVKPRQPDPTDRRHPDRSSVRDQPRRQPAPIRAYGAGANLLPGALHAQAEPPEADPLQPLATDPDTASSAWLAPCGRETCPGQRGTHRHGSALRRWPTRLPRRMSTAFPGCGTRRTEVSPLQWVPPGRRPQEQGRQQCCASSPQPTSSRPVPPWTSVADTPWPPTAHRIMGREGRSSRRRTGDCPGSWRRPRVRARGDALRSPRGRPAGSGGWAVERW